MTNEDTPGPASTDEPSDSDARTTGAEVAPEASPSLSLLQMVGSALAAAVGVQSSANRKRDFAKGKAGPFIAIGILGTVIFVLAMFLLVKVILKSAGAS